MLHFTFVKINCYFIRLICAKIQLLETALECSEFLFLVGLVISMFIPKSLTDINSNIREKDFSIIELNSYNNKETEKVS